VFEDHPRVLDWYRRLQARPSFQTAITRWDNEKYLTLMKAPAARTGRKIQSIMHSL